METKLRQWLEKNWLLSVIVLSFVVSSVAGGIFGYYGGSLFGSIFPPLDAYKRPVASVKPQIDEEAKVIEVVKKFSPAVVSIVATKDLTYVEQGRVNPFQDFCADPFFRQFLGSQCDVQSAPPRRRTETTQVAAGTGFLVSADGLILTNKHVVNVTGADFTVLTTENKKYTGKVLAKDPVQDIALLKISGAGLPALTLGDSSKLQIGQTVIAIGNALGQFSNSVSKGVISGLARSVVAGQGSGSSEKLDQVIQTDAAINPGNSGGPLLNLSGEVIGVNTAIVQGAQNIGFAIPINQAKRDISQVKATGRISYPFLGVRYVMVDEAVKAQYGLKVDYGALIVRGTSQGEVAITPGSPAEKAGLQENDVILEINGRRVTVENDLAKQLQNLKVGETIRLKILSQEQEKTVSVVLGERS